MVLVAIFIIAGSFFLYLSVMMPASLPQITENPYSGTHSKYLTSLMNYFGLNPVFEIFVAKGFPKTNGMWRFLDVDVW